ncbi:19515_t:CDS:2 [Dentiscutata erythropus]|uniref:19515_t:CDS:1 n=1 Tax=Dentiscutata erythropus TaxID=1348616 RepID=A0A9N9FHY9_9GLOM|nr:19515_t:CDS:2 [Dentiscutata erythropus]
MVSQPTNAEASTFYTANSETGISYAVNAEATSTSVAVNSEFSTSYVVNVQPNSSYTIDTETNAICENAVYDEATTEDVNSIGIEYLTPQILSIERTEMAQCLYFDAALVDLTVIGLDDENEDIDDRFTEDIYDAKQILLNKKKEIDQENVIFTNSDASKAQQGQKAPLIPQPFTVPPRRSKFGEILGLARQAVQLAVECDDNDMELWLKRFINQKKHLLIQNEESKDSDDSEESEKENNSTIKNPAITKHRGRPATKRFKAATEKPRRQPYTCQSCGKTGHNSARCQMKGG